MKIKLFIATFLTCFSLCAQEEISTDPNAYMDKSPYQFHAETMGLLIQSLENIPPEAKAQISAEDWKNYLCQVDCAKIGKQISERYFAMYPTFKMQDLMSGNGADHYEKWSEEVSKCSCD